LGKGTSKTAGKKDRIDQCHAGGKSIVPWAKRQKKVAWSTKSPGMRNRRGDKNLSNKELHGRTGKRLGVPQRRVCPKKSQTRPGISNKFNGTGWSKAAPIIKQRSGFAWGKVGPEYPGSKRGGYGVKGKKSLRRQG